MLTFQFPYKVQFSSDSTNKFFQIIHCLPTYFKVLSYLGHVAAGIVLIDVLLLLHILLSGIGVLHLQQLADGIVVVVFNPAVGIFHLGDAAHAIIGIGGGAAIGLGDCFDSAPPCIRRPGPNAISRSTQDRRTFSGLVIVERL